MNRLVSLVAVAFLFAASAAAQPFSTNFDQFGDGTPSESLNVPGIRFAPNPPGTWIITETFFTGLTGKVLFQPTGAPGTLDIIFSAPVQSTSFNFAMNSETSGATSVVVQAYNGTNLVGTVRQPTTFIGSFFAEGAASITSLTPFDRIRLAADPGNVEMAIDNVTTGQGGVNLLRIVSFTATPTQISAGQSATLSFITQGAQSVQIDNGIGAQPTSGAVTVTPSRTTTYTVTALSGPLTATSSVTVVVNTDPAISVSSFPAALIQQTGSSGAASSYTVANTGGGSTTVTVSQSGNFFTQSPTSFTLAPGASQVVTVTANSQAPNVYDGFATLSGNGVPAGLRVPIRLLVAAPPAAPVVARAIDNRVDVSGGVNPSGSARFTNPGPGTLTGTVVSDVPWLIPGITVVTIPPGQTVTVPFTIDRSKRSDADSLLGSAQGSLALYYISFTGAGKGSIEDNQSASPAINITKASVVDTVPPPTGTGVPPAIASGEVALFVAGLGHVQGSVGLFISDVSVLNPLSNKSVDDLKFFYTPTTASSLNETKTANVSLASARNVTLGDVVKTTFGQDSQGTLQLRSRDADKLSVSATVFNSGNAAGTYGTTIPVIRSDRAVGPGDSVVLTGLRADATSHTNLYLQEVNGSPMTVQTEFFAANGSSLGSRTDDLGPFGLKQIGQIVPQGGVAAVLTTTAGRFQAFATPVDRASGDTWAVADWSRFYGYPANQTTVVPVAGVLQGAANTFFRTDLAIMNRGTGQASGTLTFINSAGASVSRTITLGGRQSSILANVVGDLFGAASGSVGFLTFTPIAGEVAVTSRTYTTVAGQAATFGTGVPTLASSGAIRRGGVRAIASLSDASVPTVIAQRPATFRTNFGMLETSGQPAKVRVTLKFTFPAGSKVSASGTASKDYDLGANQFLLVNGLAGEILGPGRANIGDLQGIEADFQVIDGNGAVMVFTSSVDNGTGDTILRTD